MPYVTLFTLDDALRYLAATACIQCCQIRTRQTAAHRCQVAQFPVCPLKLHWPGIGLANRGTHFFARGTGVKSSPIMLFSHSVSNTGSNSLCWTFKSLNRWLKRMTFSFQKRCRHRLWLCNYTINFVLFYTFCWRHLGIFLKQSMTVMILTQATGVCKQQIFI